MKIIGSKKEIERLTAELLERAATMEEVVLVKKIRNLVLIKKVRFPVLEHFSDLLFSETSPKQQLALLDNIAVLKEIGGNVIIGKVLQLRLNLDLHHPIQKATGYIIDGDEWYVCDIISESVMGYALLKHPLETLPILEQFFKQSNHWIVRSIGAAIHYAVKKGLSKKDSERAFFILLSCVSVHHPDVKKGIGRAVKTIAKFHPDIISKYRNEIDTNPEIKKWFKASRLNPY